LGGGVRMEEVRGGVKSSLAMVGRWGPVVMEVVMVVVVWWWCLW
jgi:hypothetical protein